VERFRNKKTVKSWERNNPTQIPRKEWEYLLGVLHGDGYLYKNSMSIAIGYNDEKLFI